MNRYDDIPRDPPHASCPRPAPEAHTSVDFDWAEVVRNLDDYDKEAVKEATLTVVHGVIMHLLSDRWANKGGRTVGLRGIALAWVLYPSRFGNMSQEAIAKRLGIKRAHFCEYVTEAARTFRLRHPGQRYNRAKKGKGKK